MFSVRRIINTAITKSVACPAVRAISFKTLDLSVDNNGIAVMTMQRPPVNSLGLDILQEMKTAIDEAEKNNCKGLIITSAHPAVFSAGLDLNELYKPDLQRLHQLYNSLQDIYRALLISKVPTAAAINGYAGAGICVIIAVCEYRVMVEGNFKIGVQDTLLNIVPPWLLYDIMVHTLGYKDAELALTGSTMFTVSEALKVGLIDETANDKEDCVEKCRQFVRKFDNIPKMARSIAKQRIRAALLNSFDEKRARDLKEMLQNFIKPKTQETLETYLKNMKKTKTGQLNVKTKSLDK